MSEWNGVSARKMCFPVFKWALFTIPALFIMQSRHVISEGANKLKSANFSWFLIMSDNLFSYARFGFSIGVKILQVLQKFGAFIKRKRLT